MKALHLFAALALPCVLTACDVPPPVDDGARPPVSSVSSVPSISSISSISSVSSPSPAAYTGPGCRIAGCSNHLCVNDDAGDIITTCEWRDEYACYRSARCEMQPNGACGWTQSSELLACLADPPAGS